MRIASRASTIGVFGAGIMGCCVALELAQRGYMVDLLDLANSPMTGSSLNNEGKIHLGFVYANDPLKKTHHKMLKGAFEFARIIEKLTGKSPSDYISSKPFHYYVPTGSDMDITALENHFQSVEDAALEFSYSTGDRYLGLKPDRFFRRNSSKQHESLFCPQSTQGSFYTEERSISTQALADILSHSLRSHPNIQFLAKNKVQAVSRTSGDELDVDLSKGSGRLIQRYPCVVNCLWDDMLRIDSTVGVNEPDEWIHRYKATIRLSTPQGFANDIPSATGVHGPYGDVVNFSNGQYYISWYPLCKLVQSTHLHGRTVHEQVHKKLAPRLIRKLTSGLPGFARLISSRAHTRFIEENISQIANYVPSALALKRFAKKGRLGGGVILARGRSDIDNPESQLHQRLPAGPVAHGSYVTVDTGKLTTAPSFALETADMVAEVMH